MLTPTEKGIIQDSIDALKTTIRNSEASLQADVSQRSNKDPKHYENAIAEAKDEIARLQDMLDHPESHTLGSADNATEFQALSTRIKALEDVIDSEEVKKLFNDLIKKVDDAVANSAAFDSRLKAVEAKLNPPGPLGSLNQPPAV